MTRSTPNDVDALPDPRSIWLLGLGAGLGAASLYYNQPMLGTLAVELRASAAELGYVPTLTQLGYAGGILFLAPFGDRYDRRTPSWRAPSRTTRVTASRPSAR